MVWVRELTISTERPPLVGEVIANFCGYRVPRGQRDGSLLPYSRFSRQEPLLFYQVAPQLYSRGWVDHVPDPLLFFPLVVPWIEPGPPDLCSPELWPLDHRGGRKVMHFVLKRRSDICWLALETCRKVRIMKHFVRALLENSKDNL
jgi:hypothetical protein